MKTLINSIVILITLFVLPSCDEKMSYEARLVFANSHSEILELTLYPKDKYKEAESLYKMSDIGSGYLDIESDFLVDEVRTVFYSSNYDAEPSSILSTVFDSITFSKVNDKSQIIIFKDDPSDISPNNPFVSIIIWSLDSYDAARPDMYNSNPVKVNEYTYTIDSLLFLP